MKYKLFSFILGLIVLCAIIFIVIYQFGDKINQATNSEPVNNKLTVAATIFPLSDIVKNVGGDNVEVINIITPGASPHTFEPKPSNIRELQNVKVLFTVGHGMDSWATDLVDGIDNVQIVSVDKDIVLAPFTFGDDDEPLKPGMDGLDPHYWLSVSNAKQIAKNMAEILSEVDPDNTLVYQDNADNYVQELDRLQQDLMQKVSTLSSHVALITFHDSWGYFSREFGFKLAGVFESAPGKEPSPQYFKDLYDTAVDNNIEIVFTEPQLATGSIEPFIQDLDLKIYTLDPLGGIDTRDSYINLINYNIQTIYDAFSK